MVTLPKASLKLPQRRLGLSLVGWNAPDRELEDMIEKYSTYFAQKARLSFHLFIAYSDGKTNAHLLEQHAGQYSWANLNVESTF